MNDALQLGFLPRSRVRLVRQTEVAECGLACLAMVAGYHGNRVDLGTLRRRFEPSMRGAALKSLIAIADKMGLGARPVKLPIEKIGNLELPAILHWDLNHYVVLERVKGGKALIHNPDGTSRDYTMAELSNHFTGVALELRPTDEFRQADERQRLRLSQLWRRMTGLKRALAQTLVLTLVLQAFVLGSPYYMQIAIDQALPSGDWDLLAVLALGFGVFTLINVAAAMLRSFVLMSAGTSLSYGITTNLARRLLRLPVAWFEKRHVGDVLSRFQSITPIQNVLTQGAVAAILDGALAVLTLSLMFFYSAALALVALIAFLLYLAVRIITFSLQRANEESAIVAHAKEQSALIESLRGITTLRLFNSEELRQTFWQTRLTDAVNADIGLARIGIWQSSANTFIFGMETVLSVWLAVGLVMGGGFSIGMIFAYMAYKNQFLDKASNLIDQWIAFRMLGLHLERISDIALAKQDIAFRMDGEEAKLLEGRIELRDVSYRYSPTEPLVLEKVDLAVEAGEHVAITGPSGGGKSTLVKILLGLVEPVSGEVLVDGVPLTRLGHRNYRSQIAAVLQDDNLFAGSIADNIALFDDKPDMERIRAAARAASIDADIMAMPMRYETLVGDMGSSLSGGQKQRVLLARALYRRPRVLIMDEGTSHLDGAHERAVNAAVSRLGITRIVIAHRAETIAAAERVYIMNKGFIQEKSCAPAMSYA